MSEQYRNKQLNLNEVIQNRIDAYKAEIEGLLKLKYQTDANGNVMGLSVENEKRLASDYAALGVEVKLQTSMIRSDLAPAIMKVVSALRDWRTKIDSLAATTLEGFRKQLGFKTTDEKAGSMALTSGFLNLNKLEQVQLLLFTDISKQLDITNPQLKTLVNNLQGLDTPLGKFINGIRQFANLAKDLFGIGSTDKNFSGPWKDTLSQLTNFFSDWLKTGGKKSSQDLIGEGMSLAHPAFTAMGTNLAQFLGMGSDMFGPMGSLIGGVAGWGLGRLLGSEQKVKIDQIVDMRLVEINPRLSNFFNFRGLNVYNNRFAGVVEGGPF
jgi:hypothetical protein